MTFRLRIRFMITWLAPAIGLSGLVWAEPPFPHAQVVWLPAAASDHAHPVESENPVAADAWVPAMREVHARFSGTRGTFAQFGDSISVSMAFWTPLDYEPQGISDALKADWQLVKEYQLADCWREWKGPDFGNEGRMTIRWADENIDRWLQKLNPEVAVILFGSNDLTEMNRDEYARRMRTVVDCCLQNGTIVILTTAPPRSGLEDKARDFAQAVRQVAQQVHVPIVDYHAEILRRRPDDWNGAMDKFRDVPGDTYNVPTLIARDGLHPSNPAEFQQFSESNFNHNGFLLRNAMTLRAYAAIIRAISEDP